ncbi:MULTISPECIES: hypothetical protein [unclassified Streptomyces]|uniref:hypothetical protein n=1 Tax=unclassified Streptomyces TaxID=2593676 RepID=UPI00339367A6
MPEGAQPSDSAEAPSEAPDRTEARAADRTEAADEERAADRTEAADEERDSPDHASAGPDRPEQSGVPDQDDQQQPYAATEGSDNARSRDLDPDRQERSEPEAWDGQTPSSPVDEANQAMEATAGGMAKVAVAVAETAAGLVGQAMNALDEAASSASFEADAARAGATVEGAPDTRSDALAPTQGTTPDGEWEDGDPPAAGMEGPEQAGAIGEQRPNPWLNLGQPAMHAATDGGGARVPPDGPRRPDDPDDDSDDEDAPGEPTPADSADSGESDAVGTPPHFGAPPRDDKGGDDEDRPDVEMKELKPEELKLEPDVERMHEANRARATEAQQAYDASRQAQDRDGGAYRAQEGREGPDQERDVPGKPDKWALEASRNVAALGFADVTRAAVNRVSSVPDVAPGVTKALRRDLEQRRGLGLGKDMGLG